MHIMALQIIKSILQCRIFLIWTVVFYALFILVKCILVFKFENDETLEAAVQ